MGTVNSYSTLTPKQASIAINPLGTINGTLGEGVGGYRYSVCSYNFDVSHGDLRDGKGLKVFHDNLPSFTSPPKKAYFYKRFKDGGGIDDRILFYCQDTYVYEWQIGGNSLKKLASLKFASTPVCVCYNFNGEDVAIFSSTAGGMKIYDGNNVTSVSDAPTVSSMCVHNERLFVTDGSTDNSLWFSDDFDPTNWAISLSEAGFIDMSGFRGRLLKVVCFGGYVYVFRTYGITRVTAYGDQSEFSVVDLYVSSGKILEESITVCGDCILFFASDGLYRFDGLNAKRISDAYSEFINLTDEDVIGEYFDGRAYFLLSAKFDGVSERAVLNLDPKNYSEYYFIRGGNLVDLETVCGEGLYSLLLLSQNKAYALSQDGKIGQSVPQKSWLGKFGDFGVSATRKLLKEICFFSDADVSVTVNYDANKRTYSVKGKTTKTVLKPNLRGDRFSVRITATEAKNKISGLSLRFEYYDD